MLKLRALRSDRRGRVSGSPWEVSRWGTIRAPPGPPREMPGEVPRRELGLRRLHPAEFPSERFAPARFARERSEPSSRVKERSARRSCRRHPASLERTPKEPAPDRRARRGRGSRGRSARRSPPGAARRPASPNGASRGQVGAREAARARAWRGRGPPVQVLVRKVLSRRRSASVRSGVTFEFLRRHSFHSRVRGEASSARGSLREL